MSWPMFARCVANVACLLAACLAAGTPASAEGRKVEFYGAGDQSYVRSLAVDAKRHSLWVGASNGVLEIDLTSMDPRNRYTRKDGLANEYIFAIGLAPNGAVWFGTNAGGASRLQNGEWRTFFPMHGLADYWVYAFAFDDRERVWIGTWDGASLYDPKTGVFTTYHDKLINPWVYGVDIDSDGRVWFGTEGGVTMFDGSNWRSWTHADGLGAANVSEAPASANTGLGTKSRHNLDVSKEGGASYNENYVFAVHVDTVGRGVWFGLWGGGAALLSREGVWTNYTSRDGLSGDIVYSLAQDAEGVMWFGTDKGVSSFDGKRWTSHDIGRKPAHVYALSVSGGGDVFAGVKGGVLRLLAPKATP